jgi:hypothetical protein
LRVYFDIKPYKTLQDKTVDQCIYKHRYENP